MKNKKRIAILAVFVVLALAACSNTTQNITAGEDAEKSSGELIADSLEYLLNGEVTLTQTEVQEEETDTADEKEDTDQIEVTIYYGNGASKELNMEVTTMEELSADNLITALGRHNIVSLGTKVNSFEEQDTDGVKMLFLDLSKTFREYLRTMTKEGENVILSSVAATFLEAYDADGIVITIDGKPLETDHAIYEEPFGYAPEQLLLPGNNEEKIKE